MANGYIASDPWPKGARSNLAYVAEFATGAFPTEPVPNPWPALLIGSTLGLMGGFLLFAPRGRRAVGKGLTRITR